MIRPSERVNQSIIALYGNPNWEEFVKWLEDSFTKESADHINDMVSNEAKYRVQQGQIRQLFLIRNYIVKARENLTLSKKEKENLGQHPNLEGI